MLEAARPAVFTVAVIGNPNTGKTTLFNALTGLNQHVGNYPGVTVERKIGRIQAVDGTLIDLIDLPGTYSLAARSPDEMIVADVLLGQQRGTRPVDAILVIADASNPERNFYLLSQLHELGIPLVLALNMVDVARSKGLKLDVSALAAALGVAVVATCANKRKGLSELRAALSATLVRRRAPAAPSPVFSPEFNGAVDGLWAELRQEAPKLGREPQRLEAFRALVDKNGYAETRLTGMLDGKFAARLEAYRQQASRGSLPAEEVRVRYAWVKQILAGALHRPERPIKTTSDAIDKLATHWFSGTLIFALLMALVFQSIFSWASPLMELVKGFFDHLAALAGGALAPGPLQSLLCDGVLAGVGGVLVFLPQICILFFFIALLEDCGYMARAAFLMDRLFSRAGLSGKSFIPMLSSFACAVPGIMATRTIENPRDRLATILITPLMSCSARLPIYAIMISVFIPDTTFLGGWLSLRGLTLFGLYGLGIALALPLAWLLKRTLLRGETPPFLIELPSYKWPDWRTVVLRVYDRGKAFLLRAGTIILAVAIIVWALAYFPHPEQIGRDFEAQREALTAQVEQTADPEARAELEERLAELNQAEAGEYLRQSYFGRMGRRIEPLFRPLGWDWRISMAALASFPAREVVVSTLSTIFNLGANVEEQPGRLATVLQEARRDDSRQPLFNIPVALSIMVFFALCSQCAATLATIKRETASWRWPLFAFTYLTLLAYGGAFVTYQAAMAAGWGA